MSASNIHRTMLAENMTVEQAAEDWELPVEAIDEIVRYCEWDKALIDFEADEEARDLIASGLAPSASRKKRESCWTKTRRTGCGTGYRQH